MGELHASTHWLRCRHQIGDNGFDYRMPCNIIKVMHARRLKVEVFGNRYRGGDRKRIRYVDAYRVKPRTVKETDVKAKLEAAKSALVHGPGEWE